MNPGYPFGVLAISQPALDTQVQFVGPPDPRDVEVDNLGFLGLNRDKRVKLLPEGFSRDALPRSTSSLFAIANRRGLFAAAGPKSFVIGSTASLREAFTQEGDFAPQLAIPSPISISHIAFNADESHIILGASSGGVAVYSIDALSGGGDTKATFEVGTDGQELREVKPNPKIPELVAIVTLQGDVRMLDLNMRAFKPGLDGSPVLKSSVGTVAWSKLGKQIICGMGDGTGWQMTPEGEVKATLPPPPGLDNHYVSSIVWLENNLFITTYTPVPTGGVLSNESSFHLLERKGPSFEFTRLADPSPSYGMEERAPPYYFTAQLRQYPPALGDMVMFTGTCSTDIGVLVRFTEQNKEVPAKAFVVAQFPDDTRRAEIPLGTDQTDSSPIGMALDLGAKANVKRPVGGDEIDESPGPLPVLMVLNYEGVLAAWHVVYDDAIEKGEKCPAMVIYESEQTQQYPQAQPPQTPKMPPPAQQMASPFTSPKPTTSVSGQSMFGTASPFSTVTPGSSSFGQPLFGASTFGQPVAASSGSAFGKPATFGPTASQWGAQPSTPTSVPSSTGPAPAFGQPPQLGAASPAVPSVKPTFGQAPQLGSGGGVALAFGRQEPSTGAPMFGQASTLGGTLASSNNVSAVSNTLCSGAGFAAFANKGGFAAATQVSNTPQGGSIFGSGGALPSSSDSAFGGNKTGGPSIGSGVAGFKLGSAFKAEPSQAEDRKPGNGEGALGSFGSMLGGALGSTHAPASTSSLPTSPFSIVHPATLSSPFANVTATISSPLGKAPAATSLFAAPVRSPFSAAAAATTSPFAGAPSSSFSSLSKSQPTGSVRQSNPFAANPASNPFGTPSAPTAPSSSAVKSSAISQLGTPASSPPEEAILPSDFVEPLTKSEPSSDGEGINVNIPEAPLPPDTISRPPYAAGSTTTEGTPTHAPDFPSSPESFPPDSPVAEEAPFPPDLTTPKKVGVPEIWPALPEDDESDGADDERDGDEEEDEEEAYDEERDDGEEESSEDDEDEDEEEEEERPPRHSRTTPTAKKSSSLSILPGIKRGGKVTRSTDRRSAGGRFNLKLPEKPKAAEPASDLFSSGKGAAKPASGLFSSDTNATKPSGGLFGSAAPQTPTTHPFEASDVPKPRASPSLFSRQLSPGPSSFAQEGSPVSQQVPSRTASRFALPKVPTTPRASEVDNAKSEAVDLDAEYSDREDEKLREQLLNAPIKPNDNLPEVKKLREAELKEDFNHVFDSIYQSGNMMVNKLGQMARGLQSYHLTQQKPVEGVKHESPEDMRHIGNWRLCEMGLISKTIDDLMRDVKEINQEKPELEEKRQTAAKGFIKLDTKESEIQRLFAVHNDPVAAAHARARLLAPEQQLQQRQLRKTFARVEKALKDTEYKATMFKAKIAARDRHKAQAKFQPPTVEAVRTTVLKLTAMAERKSKDVEYLEEKLRRVRLGSWSRGLSATPGRFDTLERELETPTKKTSLGGYGLVAPTPVMAVVEEGDVEEIVEEHKRRKEAGRKLKGALQKRGARFTT